TRRSSAATVDRMPFRSALWSSRRRFGSRGLRPTPQGYSPWTSLARALVSPYLRTAAAAALQEHEALRIPNCSPASLRSLLCGAKGQKTPFVVPAIGSHGGATAEGQRKFCFSP